MTQIHAPSLLQYPASDVPSVASHWIAPASCQFVKNVYFDARRSFDRGELNGATRLTIAAESAYRLFVNGTLVGIGPVRGTATVNFADTYDVAPLLTDGENWIAVQVRCDNTPNFRTAPSQPALRMQFGPIVTDSSWQVRIAKMWRQDVGPYTYQVGHMQWCDLRLQTPGWMTGADRHTDWLSAEVIASDQPIHGRNLLPRDIPALTTAMHDAQTVPIVRRVGPLTDANDAAVAKLMTDEPHFACDADATTWPTRWQRHDRQGVTISPDASGGGFMMIVDFGKEINGGLTMEIDAPAGTIMDVGYDELIRNDRLITDVAGYHFSDRYLLSEGRQTVQTQLADRGFRYLQFVFRNFSTAIHVYRVQAMDRRYPTPTPATFVCNDSILNRLWTTSIETISACATDTLVDCPWRENAFWVNDFLVENLFWLQANGDGRLSARCLKLALSQQREDGLIPGVCPTDGNDWLVLVATNLFMPIVLRDYWLYAGEKATVDETIDTIGSVVKAFKRWEDAEGLITPPRQMWNFIDWSLDAHALTGKTCAMLNWYYVLAMDALAEMLVTVGRSTEALPLRTRAERTAAAIDRTFWVAKEERYAEWFTESHETGLSMQISHALALMSGRVPESRRAAVAAALMRDDCLTPELYFQTIVMQALSTMGRVDESLARIRRYWTPIINAGAPTVWEANVHQFGKSAFSDAGSLCHGFSLAPMWVLQADVLGVRPTARAWVECEVDPKPGDLTWASGSVPTPHGRLDISWQRDGATLQVQLTVPTGSTAKTRDGRSFGAGAHAFTMAV